MIEKSKLPITARGSEIQVFVPETDAVIKGIEVASTPEAADYLLEVHTARMEHFGPSMVENAKQMRKTLEEHSINMHFQRNSLVNIWAGMLPQSQYNNYQDNLANQTCEKLRANQILNVKIDLALSNSSQFLRAFTSNDNPLDVDSQLLCDELLGNYFAKNNLFIKVTEEGSFIYENDGKGGIRMDEKNKPVKADPKKVQSLFVNEQNGLKKYLKEHGIDSSVKNHPYPGEAPAVPTPGETPSAPIAPEEGPVPTA